MENLIRGSGCKRDFYFKTLRIIDPSPVFCFEEALENIDVNPLMDIICGMGYEILDIRHSYALYGAYGRTEFMILYK